MTTIGCRYYNIYLFFKLCTTFTTISCFTIRNRYSHQDHPFNAGGGIYVNNSGVKLNTMNIHEALAYLKDHRYEITQKDFIYFLNDIDDSNSQLEAYNEKELIALAEQLKEEFSK